MYLTNSAELSNYSRTEYLEIPATYEIHMEDGNHGPTEVRKKTTVSESSSFGGRTTKKRTKSIHRARET